MYDAKANALSLSETPVPRIPKMFVMRHMDMRMENRSIRLHVNSLGNTFEAPLGISTTPSKEKKMKINSKAHWYTLVTNVHRTDRMTRHDYDTYLHDYDKTKQTG